MHRNRLLEVEPFKEMQFLGKKDRTVTIENTSFRAKLTAAGIAEVKRMLAEDASHRLTSEQIRSFPGTRRMAIAGLIIAIASGAATIGKIFLDIYQDRKEPPIPEVQLMQKTQLSTESKPPLEVQLKDTSSTGIESRPDTVPGKK